MKGQIVFFLISAIWWCLTNAHAGHDHDPPKIPDRFSLRAEFVNEHRHEIHSFVQTVDFTAKFFRRDFVAGKAKVFKLYERFGDRPLVIIDDFKTGHEFVIDRWRQNCTLMKIRSQGRYDFKDKSDPYEMKDAFRWLFAPGLEYVKSDTLRGIPVDVFQRQVNETTQVKFYFLQHTWDSLSDQDNNKLNGVPVAIDFLRYDNKTNTSNSLRTHLYDYTTDHTEFASLSMKSCFRHLKSQQIDVQLTDKQPEDLLASLDMKYAVMKNLSSIMDVPFSRIADLGFRQDKDNRWVMSFRVYEPITAPSYLPHPSPPTSVDRAVGRLKRTVEQGYSFVVPDFGVSASIRVTDVKVRSDDIQASATHSTDSPSQGGVIAGVGIALLIVGLIGGFGIAFILRKRLPCDKEVPFVRAT